MFFLVQRLEQKALKALNINNKIIATYFTK